MYRKRELAKWCRFTVAFLVRSVQAMRHAGRVAFDGRVHVWDAAAREWLLPRVAALSESKAAADALRAMIKRMLEPDPSKRPTFPELLEELT